MSKHVLLTGAGGFVGQVLVPLLLAKNYSVTGISFGKHPIADNGANWISLDVNDRLAVFEAVKRVKPSHVIHLAAQSHVPTSFHDPWNTWQTNVIGTVNLLEAVRQHAFDSFFLYVSSSEVYGASFKIEQMVSEQIECQPMNPYAASKLAAELAVNQYFRQGLAGVIARPFNHIGVGQSPQFVIASFAQQIAAIEAGKQKPVLKVGNLNAKRDFLDVRDVCEAYLKLIELHPVKIEDRLFNIASGKPWKIHDLLKILLQNSPCEIVVERDKNLMRLNDISVAAGDSTRLSSLISWQARVNIRDTLLDVLNYWRSQ